MAMALLFNIITSANQQNILSKIDIYMYQIFPLYNNSLGAAIWKG